METIQYIFQSKKFRVVVFGVLGFILFFVLISVYLRIDAFTLHQIGRSYNQSTSFDGTNLYGFNGSAFYKQSVIDQSDPVVLGEGKKLPQITYSTWAGERGVLLNFDKSYINTELDRAARAAGLGFSEKTESTWFYDFKTNSLKYVKSNQIYNGQALFADKDLFFITSIEGAFVVNRYEISTGKNREYFIPMSDFQDFRQLTDCPSLAMKVCFIAKKSGNPRSTGIFTFNKDGGTELLYEVEGDITYAGSGKYLLFKSSENKADLEDGNVPTYEKLTIYDQPSGETMTSSGEFTADSFIPQTYSDDSLALIGSQGNYQTVTKKILGYTLNTGRISLSNGSDFESGIIIRPTFSKNGTIFESTNGYINLFAQKGFVKRDFSRDSDEEVDRSVKSCLTDRSSHELDPDSGLVTIFIPDNQQFSSNVEKTSKCINSSLSIGSWYNFTFNSVDPVSGRRTSN